MSLDYGQATREVLGRDGLVHDAVWYGTRTVCRKPYLVTIPPPADTPPCPDCAEQREEGLDPGHRTR